MFNVIKLRVEYGENLFVKGSGLSSGFIVKVSGYQDRNLPRIFNSQNNAKIAAERLLWKIVNEMHQDLSQYTWDTYNKEEEVKWVQR